MKKKNKTNYISYSQKEYKNWKVSTKIKLFAANIFIIKHNNICIEIKKKKKNKQIKLN